MSWTPFLEELRAQIKPSAIIGKHVKLIRSGREFHALCPFHQEKSPSFTINDQKGFYHCFGCGVHGDSLRFVMEYERLEFRDAVEKLAAIAGIQVPRFSEKERESVARKQQLYNATEAAAMWFSNQLQSGAGAAAREYLRGRGVSEEIIRRFRLGVAPDQRDGLKRELLSKNISEEQMLAVNLITKPDEAERNSFDRFRNRLMFPILDRRGRVVAFGGRIMGEGQPKYLNSSETELFHKGKQLYNEAQARAGSENRLIVVEGYMDVIALAQAGITEVVAPLGTALTDTHLQQLWQIHPLPLVCLDGDQAGIRAMQRVAQMALPLINEGKSLAFLPLPAGEDPDSLVRKEGAENFLKRLENPIGLSDVIWEYEHQKTDLNTPEKRAGLESRLMQQFARIKNQQVAKHYRKEFWEKMRALDDAKRRSAKNIKNNLRTNSENLQALSSSLRQIPKWQADSGLILEIRLMLATAHNSVLLQDREIFEEMAHLNWSDENLSAHCEQLLAAADNSDELEKICKEISAFWQNHIAGLEVGKIFKEKVSQDEARRGWRMLYLDYLQRRLRDERDRAFRSGNETKASEINMIIDKYEHEKRTLMLPDD